MSHLVIAPERLDGNSNQNVQVAVDVTNTGSRAGAEVAQVYIGHPRKNGEPPRQLSAFAKVELKPGETRHLMLTLNKRSFSVYNPAGHQWITPAGAYQLMVGTSSRELPLHGSIMIGAARQ